MKTYVSWIQSFTFEDLEVQPLLAREGEDSLEYIEKSSVSEEVHKGTTPAQSPWSRWHLTIWTLKVTETHIEQLMIYEFSLSKGNVPLEWKTLLSTNIRKR